MRHKALEVRPEFIESTVGGLVDMPRQIHTLSAQILQFRGEVREEISAVRGEIREVGETLRTEMHQDLGSEIEHLDVALRAEIHKSEANLAIQIGVLHDQMMDRIATLVETTASAKNGRQRKSTP